MIFDRYSGDTKRNERSQGHLGSFAITFEWSHNSAIFKSLAIVCGKCS